MENAIRKLEGLDLSKLHFYSYGIVVEDNLDNLKEIKVYPVEKLYTQGDDLITPFEYKPATLKFYTKKVKIVPHDIEPRCELKPSILPLERTDYLFANWLGLNSPNRLTPPNLCKGEHVILYRYTDSDEFFWDMLNINHNLRKEEHVVYGYSDKPHIFKQGDTYQDEEEPLEDKYYIEISPKNKRIHLHLGKKYGEYTDYDITIKTDDGWLEIKDGVGNNIKLDSPTKTLTTHLEGDEVKYDFNIHGNDQMVELKDSKNNNITLDSKSDTLTTSINKTINSQTETHNIVATTINMKANVINIDAPSINVKNGETKFSGGTIKHDDMSIDKYHEHTGNLGFNTSPPVN